MMKLELSYYLIHDTSVSYEYDELERVSEIYYNGSSDAAVSYTYSNNGSVSKIEDHAANRVNDYNYDSLGRLITMTEKSGSNAVQFYAASYDSANRVKDIGYMVSPAWNGTFRDGRAYGYTYDADDGKLTGMQLPADGSYAYTYDALKRLTGRSLSLDGTSFINRNYTYLDGNGTNATTMLVASMNNRKANGTSINSYTYTYDNTGNITAISGSTSASYTYDAQGQLLTETYGGKTYTYTYDTYGNIRSVSDGTTTKVYSYGDSSWLDLLTAYDGQSISYDSIGNPTSWYDGTTFTWSNWRRLTSAVNSSTGLNNSYTYDMDGLRLTKTVGSVEHKYVWQGSKLVAEYFGGTEFEFFYDENGAPYAFSYKATASATPVMYYYVTNLQGDVVSILNASGTSVAEYSYNAWGKVLSATGTMAAINPIRYRGYYFDSDSGLYYLKSRYYDPNLQRFINSDTIPSTGQKFIGANMFAYCLNNPVGLYDVDGNFPIAILASAAVGAVIGAMVGGVFGAINAKASGQDPRIGAMYGALTGGLTGAITGIVGAVPAVAAGVKVAAVATNAAIAGYSDYESQKRQYSLESEKSGKTENFKVDKASIAISAASASIGSVLGLHLTTAKTVVEAVVTGITSGKFASMAVGAMEMMGRAFLKIFRK